MATGPGRGRRREAAKRIESDRKAARRAIGSQFSSACYREAGLDLAPDAGDACTSPGRVEMRAVLRRPR